MKNVLVLATTFPRKRNDTEPAFVFELSKRLTKTFNVTALVPHAPHSKTKQTMEGVQVIRFPYFFPLVMQQLCYNGGISENMKRSWMAKLQVPFLVFSELIATLWHVSQHKTNLIHAHWIIPQGLIALIVSKLCNIPYVITAHAGDVFPLKNKWFKKLARIIVNNASACTANSTFTSQKLKALNITTPVSIIPMGVDLTRFTKRITTPKKHEIIAAGRLAEKKGFVYLIRAFSEVRKKFPHASLTIIGDGPQREKLQNEVSKLKLSKHVTFKGKVSHQQLPSLLKSGAVFVGPSIVEKNGDTEGLGVVFIEALACGIPVIGTDVGGIPDIIQNNKTGLLVKQKDPKGLSQAIIKMFENPTQANTLARQGRAHVLKTYDWEKIAKQFVSLLGK